jgi:hypothetical protein
MTHLFSVSPIRTRSLIAFALIVVTTTLPAHSRMGERLRQLDCNHDHAISLTEALNARQARFIELDLNHDGALTAAELQVRRGSKGKRAAWRMARLDQNTDEKVSRNEWDAQVANLFARVDSNSDHLITREELRALRAANPRRLR